MSKRSFVVAVFAGLILLQALGFLTMGTGQRGKGVSALILIVQNLLALACAWGAFRRGRRVSAIFWLLYAASLLAILIPTVFGAYDALFDRSTLSAATWRVLFCLYGAPILMILFLPVTDHERVKSEVFLDLLQVMILVGLIFFAFFLLPVQQMMPTDALLRNVNISNLQSLFLLGAVVVRLLFMRDPHSRNLLIRLGSFVLTCAVVTFTGNWIDVHHRAVLSAWFDLGWALPYVASGLAALTWSAPADDPPAVASPRLPSFLISNIALVTLLCFSIGLLMGPWMGAHNKMLTALAAGASLLAFTVRLALTQYHQQLEITQRKAAEEELRKLASIVECSGDAIYGKTLEGKITSWNKAAENMYGYTADEMVGKDVSALMPPENEGELQGIMERLGSGQAIECLETERLRKDGSVFSVALSISPTKDLFGRITGASSIARDISLRKRAEEEQRVAEERVQFLAFYDALTKLPNRTLLQDRLAQAIAGARRQNKKLAVLFLDLDRFKYINDSLGHSVGDSLLQHVAERLRRFAREQDTVARIGGDEFIVVLNDLKDATNAAVAAERIRKVVSADYLIQDCTLATTCSLGISIFPEHGTDGETLLKNADTAMYCAKQAGHNRFQFFTKEMNIEAMERLSLESSLRSALDSNELFLVYQPQMDIATGRVTGLEALLRWQHPGRGLVPPDQFIRIAENTGLIVPIGEWVLVTACSQARSWQREGLPAVRVAVNVSAVQFRQDGFCDLVRRVLRDAGLPPQCLELELTESLLLSNADVTVSVLKELKSLGLSLAMDDFGTGYSSLSYLKQFEPHKLKIDRSFVRDLAISPDDAAITIAIISMAKSLNLKVIAEGVEDEAQMLILRTHHCDEIQGYYFSKPLETHKVVSFLRHNAMLALPTALEDLSGLQDGFSPASQEARLEHRIRGW